MRPPSLTRLPVRQAALGIDVLAELTLRPRLRSEDIAHEREVIVEEIRSYRDYPAQFIYNVWDEAFFGDTPPARATIAVKALPLGALVEIEAVAVKG